MVSGAECPLLFHGPRGSLLSPPAYLTDEAAILEKAPSEATAPVRPGDEPPSTNFSEAKARVCGRSEVQSVTPEGQVRMTGSIVGVVKSGRWRAAKLNKDKKDTPPWHNHVRSASPLFGRWQCALRALLGFARAARLPPPQHGQPPPAGRVVRTSRIHPPARTFLIF